MFSIMIIDDNHLSADGLEAGVDWEALDAEVRFKVYDGRQALDLLEKESVDLIISDIEMPQVNGLEMSRQALAMQPFIKIILISAFDKFEYAREAIRIGAFDYIEKPIDYEYLAQMAGSALEQIKRERENREILEQSRPAMVQDFFRRLIISQPEELSLYLEQYPKYLGIDLNCHYFLVCIIRIENAEELKKTFGIQEYHIRCMNLQDDLAKAGSFCRVQYMLKEFHQMVWILGSNYTNQRDFLQEVHQIFAQILETRHHRAFEMHIGIGSVSSSVYEIHGSYVSAEKALEYCFFMPQQNIYDIRDMGIKTIPRELYSDAEEEQLIQLICQRDKVKIRGWITGFSEKLLSNYRTKSLVFIRIYAVCGRMIRLLADVGTDASDIEREVVHVYNQLDSFATADQIFEWLSHICEITVNKLDSSMNHFHDQICMQVKGYIEKHFQNHELSLNELAAFVNISPAHLSALYKKHEGQSISESITAARMEEACFLLKNTAGSIKEISEKTGYTNQYYFSAAFKKKIGITPTEYRAGNTGT